MEAAGFEFHASSRQPMSDERILVLGTHNRKKSEELGHLLAPIGLKVYRLSDFPNALEVIEDGRTFAENSRKKASQQARHLKHWVLGEDSGLVVEKLNGAPGVFSARYAGEYATDQSNNQRLLDELGDTPLDQRTAHYVCHVTLSDPEGDIQAECESNCRGRIRFNPVGSSGFGYDPLFEIVEYHRTFGELGEAVKSLLSHRGRALRMLVPKLRGLMTR